MTAGGGGSSRPKGSGGNLRLGAALRRAWVGYQRRLDEEMAAAGFDDRAFPDGRVLRMCARPGETTVSQIGRELGMTRQGASKIVAGLRDRRYVTLRSSTTDKREKVVTLTPRAGSYLASQQEAARDIERRLHNDLGEEGFAALYGLLEALGGDEDVRLRDYLRRMRMEE